MAAPLAFALPLLAGSSAGIAGTAGLGAAAFGGAAAAGGAAAGGLGTAGLLSGAGLALGGIGSLVGGIRGAGGGGQQSTPGPDYASLYAYQVAPGNTLMTAAASELAQLMAPYTGTEAIQSKILGQQAYDQFNVGLQKAQTLAGLQAGIASQYASSAIGLGDLAGKAKIATEMMGPEVASALTKQYAEGVQQLATEGLKGQTTLLTPGATALAQTFTESQRATNKLASDIASTNLDIKRQQEQTRNQLALQRGNIEGQLALKRFGAGMALAGQRAFA